MIVLPPESPDLTPHDSGFLALVKRQWHRQTAGSQMAWAEKCQLALKLIKEADPKPFIAEMPLCWKACEMEKGYHIEDRLRQLKHA